MVNAKVSTSHVDTAPYHLEGSEENVFISEKEGTTADKRDMARMGKRQETRRNFRHPTVIAFTMVILATWEAELATSVYSLGNGGTAGLIWGYLIVMTGFGFVAASMAEMASMAPTSGGQYHWVSEFAPPSCQKFLSYLVGWLGMLGWSTAAATVSYLSAKQIQGLILLNHASYEPKPWHGTLLIWAILFVCLVFNTFFSKTLPLVEGIIVILHVAGFIAVLIVLWVMADRAPVDVVFKLFEDNMGWGSTPLSVMVGLVGAASCFVGIEAGAHMAEEVRDAAYAIPRAMMWTWIGNGLFGWLMGITFAFCVKDTMSVLTTPLGVPFMQVFYNSTKSVGGATGLTCLMLVISLFGCVAVIATASRQLFVFARDKGIPFSSFFGQISPTYQIPLNAVYVTVVLVVLLSLINLGSSVAFMQVVSLGVVAMLTTYIISISCVALKRIRREPLLPSKFNLGKLGLPTNLISIMFLAFIWVFSLFPSVPRPKVSDMNWAVLGYGSVVTFSILYFVTRRHSYRGPVEYVRKG
ncbi:amino acid transporter [Lindgomyces ingoldianus]|uniref:Amino acid transporter n=1 Tax=Lindgomyces ingoldianus TaxID=673940 RepID=A0ACB6R4Q6_9PLEO|nr:amino acid transporter [Lindgomyces ingoldianus]KAF2473755.1 amino acid transporter [Lindgomyces ingoldianus]